MLQPLSSKRSYLGPEAGAGRGGAEQAGTKLRLEAVTPEFDGLPSALSQGSLSHSGCGFLRAEKSKSLPCTLPSSLSSDSELLRSTQANTHVQTQM